MTIALDANGGAVPYASRQLDPIDLFLLIFGFGGLAAAAVMRFST